MPTIYEILSNKDFQALPYDKKKQTISALNESFSSLPMEKQDEVMKHFNLVRPENNERSIAQTASDIYRPTLETAGGVLGAIAGGAISAPTATVPPAGIAAIPASVGVGGALGFAVGKSAADLIDRLTGIKPPINTLMDAANETAGNIAYGGVSEVAGQKAGPLLAKGASKLISKVGAPFAEATKKAGARVAEAARNLGVELTPSELNHSGTLGLVENVLSYLPGSRDIMAKYRLKQVEVMIKQRESLLNNAGPGTVDQIEVLGQRIQDDLDKVFRNEARMAADKAMVFKNELLRKMGSTQSYEELGTIAQDAIKRKSELMDKAAQKLYQNASELIDPTTQIVPQVRLKAVELLKQELKGAPSVRDSEAMNILMDLSGYNEAMAASKQFRNGAMPDGAMDAIMTQPASYEYLAQTRSGLGKIIAEHDASRGFSKAGQGTKFVSDRTAGIAKQLYAEIDKDLEALAKANSDEALKAVQVAKAFYRTSKETFGNKSVQAIMKSNPEAVVNMVFRPGQISQIRTLRSMVGPDDWSKFQSKTIEKLADFGTDEAISGAGLKQRLDAYGGETLSQIFNKDQINSLYSMAKDIEMSNVNALASNPFFKTIARTTPDKVVDVIVKPGNTVNITKLRDAIGQDGIEKVQEGFIQKLLLKKSVDSHGNFSVVRLDSEINRYGEKTLRSIFPADVVSSLQDMGAVGARMAKAQALTGNPSGTAQNMVAFRQGEMLITDPVKGLKLAFVPAVAAKLYLNPSVRKYLTEGLFTASTSPSAQALSSRLLSSIIAASEGLTK